MRNREPCPKCIRNGRDSRGDNFIRFENGTAHCFSCGFHENPPLFTSLGLKINHGSQIRTEEQAFLPNDFTRAVPTTAWRWLLQYGLPYSYWQNRCGYSQKEQRLIFTIGDPTIFSMGRYVRPDSISQDNSGGISKWKAYGKAHKHCEVVVPDSPSTDSITLVEDWISANKVGQVGKTISLFGTEVFPEVVFYLSQENKPVNLWLDKDQAGMAEKRALRLESLIQCPVNVIYSDNDPKSISVDKIKEIIK